MIVLRPKDCYGIALLCGLLPCLDRRKFKGLHPFSFLAI
uniref:Uncharacterized protein n=1 Tax=Arundo donax TaxID=35708 RepID=A0A0A9ESW8_ARUDO